MLNNSFQTLVERINKFLNENKAKGFEKVKSNTVIWKCLLAGYFNYNVTQGGFAQLFYNLKGEHLEEIEEILLEMGAKTALDFYIKSLRVCIEKMDDYHLFISGNYLEQNELKFDLQKISIDYFAQKIEFEDEIKDFINLNYSQILREIESLN